MKMKIDYIMIFNNQARLLKGVEGATASCDWWFQTQQQFVNDCGGRKHEWDWPDTYRLWDHAKTGNVYFDEELVSSQGASFKLIQTPDISDAEIEDAKKYILRNRDAVRITVAKVTSII